MLDLGHTSSPRKTCKTSGEVSGPFHLLIVKIINLF